MIVITNKNIAKCSEISLADTVIYGFVEACKDCSFVADNFDTEERAEETFNKIADAIKEHGDETIIDFRRG